MNSADVMTHPVIATTPETTILQAARLMIERRVSGLPVVDGSGAVVGIVTEGDLLRRFETGTAARRGRWLELLTGRGRLASEFISTHARKVGEVMTRHVVSVTPQSPLSDVAELMEKHRVRRLPVIDQGQLAGIVSRADLVRALIAALSEPESAGVSDEDIRRRILDGIAAQPWSRGCLVWVAVTNGVVELKGAVTGDDEPIALKVLAETVPGVREVRVRLVRIEPCAGTVMPPEGSPPTIV
jgi:CBS domain-containing protein